MNDWIAAYVIFSATFGPMFIMHILGMSDLHAFLGWVVLNCINLYFWFFHGEGGKRIPLDEGANNDE